MPDLLGFEPRRVCQRCRRPESVCYCEYLTRIETKTRVVLLQHPRERDVAIGTARMASLCLPNSELLIGFDWENSPELRRILSDPARPAALLYPGPDATDISAQPPSDPLTLVVVDGTWANTKKMVRANPILTKLPRVTFQPPRPSEYRIRREPKQQFVSTIEALMYVLSALEGEPRRFERLRLPFRKMVDAQLECKADRGTPRSRYKREQKPVTARIPALFLESPPERIVCVGGEANAWPCRDTENRNAYPDELVQWVAYRPHTGERFEAFVAPHHPLSPSTPNHLSVPANKLHGGGALAAMLEAWRRFVREDDVICSWGRYATSLFASHGGYLPTTRFDLRVVAKHHLKRNIGTMEEFHATLPGDPAEVFATGRAGVRLGQLARIVASFRDGGPTPSGRP